MRSPLRSQWCPPPIRPETDGRLFGIPDVDAIQSGQILIVNSKMNTKKFSRMTKAVLVCHVVSFFLFSLKMVSAYPQLEAVAMNGSETKKINMIRTLVKLLVGTSAVAIIGPLAVLFVERKKASSAES